MCCKKTELLLVLSIVLPFVFCSKPADSSSSTPITPNQVYGSWRSSQTNVNQEKTEWTLTIDSTRNFTDRTVITRDSTVLEDLTNRGTWSLLNDTLTLVFESETIIYKILAITATSMTLQDTYDSAEQVYCKL